MTEIKWEEPGLKRRARIDWVSVFAALRSRPGAWALVAENASPGTAQNIKRGRLGGASAGEFDAVMRGLKDSRGSVYARYVGGDER
jgi:hypothetical protein